MPDPAFPWPVRWHLGARTRILRTVEDLLDCIDRRRASLPVCDRSDELDYLLTLRQLGLTTAEAPTSAALESLASAARAYVAMFSATSPDSGSRFAGVGADVVCLRSNRLRAP